MFNPTTAQRVNERYRRLLAAGAENWTLPLSFAELTMFYNFVAQPNLEAITNPFSGEVAGPTLDIVRTTTSKFSDYDNVLRTVQAGEAAFTGGRRVENFALHSNALGNAVWLASGTATKTGDTLWNLPADNDIVLQTMSNDSDIGEAVTGSIVLSGTGTVTLRLTDFSGETLQQITLTTTPTRYQVTRTQMVTNDIGFGVKRAVGDTATAVTVAEAQVENVSGQADPSPSEYIATTTVAVARNFTTKRRTNYCLHSRDLGTSPWTALNSTITVNQALDPGNILTLDNIIATGSGVLPHGARQLINRPANHDLSRISFYARPGTTTFMTVWSFAGNGTGDSYYILSGEGTASSGNGATIERISEGLYRCSQDFVTTPDGAGNRTIHIGPSSANGVRNYEQAGESVHVGWVQAEVGATSAAIATTTQFVSSAFDTAITPTGLRVEEARTNILLRSENFSLSWSNKNSIDESAQGIAPDGLNTAWKISDDSAASGNVQVGMLQAKGVATSTVYTLSVYAKADQLDFMYFELDDFTTPAGNTQAFFDLSTGVVGTKSSGFSSSGIESVGNGWYRCHAVFLTDASDTSGNIRINMADQDNDANVDDDGTSSIFIWGAQLEVGAFPTSYIPTLGVSVTRNADIISTTDVSWYNAAASILYSALSMTSLPVVGGKHIVNISDSSSSDKHVHFINASASEPQLITISTTGNGVNITSGVSLVENVISRVVSTLSLNNSELYVDGTRTGSGDQTADILVGVNRLALGADENLVSKFNGHIAELRYYSGQGVNSELQDLSNGNLVPALTL